MPTVLMTEHIDPVGVHLLENAGWNIVKMKSNRKEELAEKIKGADAVLVRIMELSGDVLSGAEKLKLISKHGVGYDNIDLDAAKRLGIAVTSTPGANATSVAEHTFTLLMALAKALTYTANRYRSIGFAAKNCPPGLEISGKTIGIIGLGHIGTKVAHMAHCGFGMRVLAYDPYLSEFPEGVERVTDRDRIFAESDFVTLHCLLTDETRGSVGRHEFSLMKPGAIFLNCARGPLVDEEALIHALSHGTLGGAGLDVTAVEPCPADSPLFSLSNVILTPHFAPSTHEAATAVSRLAAQNILDFFAGKEPVGRVV